MILYSKVTEAPDYTQVVTLEEAKAHLRVSGDDDDAYITSLIIASGSICEKYAGLSFAEQVRQVKLDRFPCKNLGEIIIPYGPIQSIDEFTYIDSDGVEQTLAEDADYEVDLHSELCRLMPVEDWPSTDDVMNAVSVEYTAGYEEIPAQIKQAMLMQIGSFYENRQDEIIGTIVTEIHWTSKALLDTVKVYWNANEN